MYRRYKEQFITASEMSKLKFVLFVGSTREGRLADRVTKFVRNNIGSEHQVTVFGKYETTYYITIILSHGM